MKEEYVNDIDREVLTEKNELCDSLKECFEDLLSVRGKVNAVMTTRPGKGVKVFERADHRVT